MSIISQLNQSRNFEFEEEWAVFSFVETPTIILMMHFRIENIKSTLVQEYLKK